MSDGPLGEIDLAIEDDRWRAVDLDGITAKIVSALGLEGRGLSLLATSDAAIAELNAAYRGKAKPTNVLSWPAFDLAPETPGEAPHPLPAPDFDDSIGDLALAYETCAREAEAGGLALADHVTHLILHGILHLLGYDHETDADAALMEGLETKQLASMGLHDPYLLAEDME
ncbi:rRNA maturation RNase YbeY [Paracoccaceae bacterium GXU_MW_L88]